MKDFFKKRTSGWSSGKFVLFCSCFFAFLLFKEVARASTKHYTELTSSLALRYQNDSLMKGKVTDEKGVPIPGVSVKLKGTGTATVTITDGTFKLKAPDNGTLIFSFVGFIGQEVFIGGRKNITIKLLEEKNNLDEVVVTGYSSQRKKDIIGAVSVVSAKDLKATPSPNVVAQLQGRAAGVQVSTSGDPSATSNIRIRGFASYGNNSPLYIVDGVATTDISRINSNDIESLQVLKDASAASIYGARAANGVIIITTKHGTGGTTVGYEGYTGIQKVPLKSIPPMLSPTQLMEYLTQTQTEGFTDPVFGTYGAFAIPDYYIVSNLFKGGVSADDPRANPSLYTLGDLSNNNIYQIFKPTRQGTNWFKEMTQNAIMHNHQISASGGNDRSNFYLGLNYLNQDGTFKYTSYNRYSIRLNSTFKPTSFLTIGENLQVSFDNRKGNAALTGEGSAWSSAYRIPSFIPVRDIRGGWGGSLIGGTAGNAGNPVAQLYNSKDAISKAIRVAGNVFAEVRFTNYLFAKTSFGIDAITGNNASIGLKEYGKNEPNSITSYNASTSDRYNWILTNTLNFEKTIDADHNIKAFIGTEALKNNYYSFNASKKNYDFESVDFVMLNTGLPKSLADIAASDSRDITSLNSYFLRVDYTYKSKYLFNATYRRDGASVFGPSVRYANFPAAGLAWRISEEPFLNKTKWVDDLKLRVGWGKMGSISNVPSSNQYSTYKSAVGENNYDIDGTNNSSVQGFGIAREGNLNTKWETTETVNAGLDVTAFEGKWNLTVDVYSKNTYDLLVPSLANGLELQIVKPLINLGTMNNKGIDVVLNNRGTIIGDLKYDATLTFSHYKNELTKLNDENSVQILGAPRLNNVLYTAKGYPISSFYGYQIDGFYNTQAEVDNGLKINGKPAQIGTWKYKDLNGDNDITVADVGVIGNPHPDFQMGFNAALNWKNFDFSAFLFWNQGNQLFNYTKYFTYMGALGGSIAEGKLTEAWTPQTASTARTPKLGYGPDNGYTAFVKSNSSSFYVEDGSYLRLKTLQLGYSIPKKILSKLKMNNLRVYAQAQNLFTATKYKGGDPDLNLTSGNGTDQFLGVDLAGYPNPKQFLFGLSLGF